MLYYATRPTHHLSIVENTFASLTRQGVVYTTDSSDAISRDTSSAK